MGQKIAVVPISSGLRNDVLPFNLDNDSFPVLQNAYQWRSRIRRKRGTVQLGRLRRYIQDTDGAGAASFTLSPTPIPSGISEFVIDDETYTDSGAAAPVPTPLLTTGSGTGEITRSTGLVEFTGAPISSPIIYYPGLPVLGLEPLQLSSDEFPGIIAFDQYWSYNVSTTFPFTIYDVSYYKNPASDTINGITYTQKESSPGVPVSTPTSWNGQDYQQFWSTNYSGAFWATNGIEVPFDATNVGMQYKLCDSITYVSETELTITILEATQTLIIGDWVFINEVTASGGTADASTINFQTGFVTAAANAVGTTTLTVRFPYAAIAASGGGAYADGILQYLTNRSDVTKDCLRFYDGAPVTSTTPPSFQTNAGWVNFAPPLLSGPTTTFNIADLPPGQYYLVGARIILPFKDRLLFIGPVVQTSAAGSQRYLQDTVIYSQNGTPYYTASWAGAPTVQSAYQAMLVPSNQSAQPSSFWEDVPGYGGFISAGYQEPITCATANEDVILMGLSGRKARFVYTGNDIVPFNFYTINSEYGSESTFSSINFDRGMLDFGNRGITLTTQVSSDRIDIPIPDEVFQINLKNNGKERVTSQRDFINEWVYITYPPSDTYSTSDATPFPSQTLFYNYRDKSWAIFLESYTTYGQFRKSTGQTWDDLTEFTWDEWTDLWDSGEQSLLQPEVIGGNQRGFILFLAEGTGEDTSLPIANMSSGTVTCPNHGLNLNDYIVISGAQGTIASSVNGKIFSVSNPARDGNSFTLKPPVTTGTYLGGGRITRMYVPFIQTKQFPVAWDMGRKTRIGPQQYLLSSTPRSQITLLIYLSQNSTNSFNSGPIVPSQLSLNNSLVYSTVLFTCPESTNLGLTPSNVNLQQQNSIGSFGSNTNNQAQIWHRVNTSLLGDTIQLGFTLSDEQMRSLIIDGTSVAITGSTQANPCVLTCSGEFDPGTLITISGVVGMIQLNNNSYIVLSSTTTTVTIDVNSSQFTSYDSGGTATPVGFNNQFAEIELHSFIIDVSPSGVLA